MATASYFGRNAFVQFRAEDSWGIAKSGTDLQRPFISCSMLRQIEKVDRPNLLVSGVNGLRRGFYVAKDACTGSLSIEATYDNLNPILRQVFGAGATSAGTVNTHSYSLGDVPDQGMTMSVQRGTGQVEVFEGIVFSSFKASCSSSEVMTIDLEMMGQTSAARTTAITYTQPTNENLVLHNHAGSLSWNSQTFTMIDFDFTLENGLAERMRLGDLTTKKPTSADYRNATMTITIETDDTNGYANFLSDPTGQNAEVLFDNGLSGASRRYLQFDLHDAVITEYDDSVSETGLITATVTLKGFGDGTNHGAAIHAYNVAASASADSA